MVTRNCYAMVEMKIEKVELNKQEVQPSEDKLKVNLRFLRFL